MREEAMIALQAILTSALVGNYGFVSAAQIDRRLKHWSDVDQQPALFIVQKTEAIRRPVGSKGPTAVWMALDLVLYVKGAPEQIVSPSTIYNPILDAIFTALDPQPAGENQTLNGKAYSCLIEGNLQTDEGVLGDQAYAIVPLTVILTP